MREKLDYTINDRMTVHYLTEVNEKKLSEGQRLEVIILREIAQVSGREEIIRVFDTLWENEKIRAFVQQKHKNNENLNPLAEFFFLLTADNGSIWKNERAEKLYKKRLNRLRPEELHGYSLHFFTLALLQSGKVEAAIPFLEHLNTAASDQIKQENRVVALIFALQGHDHNNLVRIMVQICRNYANENGSFPDREMLAAFTLLQAGNEFGKTRKTLLSVLGQGLEKTAFAQKLYSGGSTPTKPVALSATPAFWQPDAVSSTEDMAKLPAPGSVENNHVVLVRVQVVRAGYNGHAIDPDLQEIAEGLLQGFNFTSLHLVNESPIFLTELENGEISLPSGHQVRIIPQHIARDHCTIEVIIAQDGVVTFETRIESVYGGVTIIGGPRQENETLLLRISPFLGGMEIV